MTADGDERGGDPLLGNPGFFDLVGNVRAMRRLRPDPVPLPLVRKVIDAGTKASSGMNTQPWEFVVVRDRAAVGFLAEHYRAAFESRFGPIEVPEGNAPQLRMMRAVKHQIDHFHETPVVILCCGLRDWPFSVPEEERIGHGPPNYGAVYPAVQNMLLACRALGLGATLTTMHQMFPEELHAHFAIPAEYGVVVMMPIGYPSGNFGPVSRIPAAEKTHYDHWGAHAPPADANES